MCWFYLSVLFFKGTIIYTFTNKKDDEEDSNTISSWVPVMLDRLNLKQLIISACSLGCRSLSPSSLLMLAKSRACIFIYVKH